MKSTALGIAAGIVVMGVLGVDPAHAASGTLAGGVNGGTCNTTVACNNFTVVKRCAALPESNDTDASVRSAAGLAGRSNVGFSWSALQSVEPPPAKNYAYVFTYDGACNQLQSFPVRTAQATIAIDGRAKWVVVTIGLPYVQGKWSMT